MISMSYTTEDEVYDTTGLDSQTIQDLSGKSSVEVTTLINGYITKAEGQIKKDIEYPIRVRQERHFGDGNKNQFVLGPEDDAFAEEGDYDPEDGLVEIYNAWFGRRKMKKPYPEECELNTDIDPATCWSELNATLSAETTIIVAGDQSLKAIFSAAGYAQTPCGVNTPFLDKIVDTWSDLFFWARLSDATATITVRIYDKDGNYAEQEVTLRQNNIGQYIWLDLDSFTNSLVWNSVRVQYIRFYVDKACTLYIDNLCFADSWAFSAPSGIFHTSVADNITSQSPPSDGYPFFTSYSYDPFLASVPSEISEAAEWRAGVYIVDFLRGIKYRELDFEVYGETMEADTPFQRGGLLGVRTNMLKSYEACLIRWGGGSYGVV